MKTKKICRLEVETTKDKVVFHNVRVKHMKGFLIVLDNDGDEAHFNLDYVLSISLMK